MKIAIVSKWLSAFGGSERLLAQLFGSFHTPMSLR